MTTMTTTRAHVSFEFAWSVREAIDTSCQLLDNENYGDWLALCADDFRYSIHSFSPEIRREMTVLDKNLGEMKLLFDQLRLHETRQGQWRRMIGGIRVCNPEAGTDTHGVVSALTVFHTDVYGSTTLFCVGRYQDRFRMTDGGPVIVSRRVLMDTRRLPFGSHVPL